MKLLYITNGINGAGGLERVLSIKASYLADHYGYEVTILSLNDQHIDPFYIFSPLIKMVSIPVSGNKLRYFASYKKGIQATVDKVQPDIISVCDDGLKGFFIPKILKTTMPIVYERHVSKEIEMNKHFPLWKKIMINTKWQLMKFLAGTFDKFVVLTAGNTKEWKTLKNLAVIPNPLSFYPTESSTLQNKKVIAVGKQNYQKGYDLLLQSWQIVQEKHPDWQLEIYGKMAPDNHLVELAQDLKIQSSVAFYPPEKHIERKYLDSSVYVMSSRFEGFGMVLIEAMACGLPCVSFDCNFGPSDIICHNEDGLLVENGNIADLSLALTRIMGQQELRKEMGRNAKENVKRFQPGKIVQTWDNLFRELKK